VGIAEHPEKKRSPVEKRKTKKEGEPAPGPKRESTRALKSQNLPVMGKKEKSTAFDRRDSLSMSNKRPWPEEKASFALKSASAEKEEVVKRSGPPESSFKREKLWRGKKKGGTAACFAEEGKGGQAWVENRVRARELQRSRKKGSGRIV